MKKLAFVIVLFAVVGLCKDHAHDSSQDERSYHALVPLGAERIELRSAHRSLYLLATAESAYFEGWHGPIDEHKLFTADGSRVESYPEQLAFRLTATAKYPDLMTIDSYATLSIPENTLNDFLLHLRFQLVVFHGLDEEKIEPHEVRLIGMPASVPYEERIYQVYFNLPHRVPIEDRIVFQVMSPTDYRLCKFHLDLI